MLRRLFCFQRTCFSSFLPSRSSSLLPRIISLFSLLLLCICCVVAVMVVRWWWLSRSVVAAGCCCCCWFLCVCGRKRVFFCISRIRSCHSGHCCMVVKCTLRDASRACELVITMMMMMMVVVQGISSFLTRLMLTILHHGSWH